MFDPYSMLLTVAVATSAQADVAKRFDRWDRRVRARVERLHVVPAEAQNILPCQVAVRFAVGNDGKPAGAQIRESSCGRYYERKALALVRDLGRIGPVPSGAGQDQRVTLKLSYGAEQDRSADRRLTEALAAERRAYASRNLATVIASPQATNWQSAER
jgi:TonB family protein